MEAVYDFKDSFIGVLKEKKLMGSWKRLKKDVSWGSGPKKMLMVITNDNTRELGGSKKNPAGNGFSYYLIFSDLNPHQIKKDWLKIEGGGDTPLLDGTPITSVAELVGKLKGTLVRLGPDLLELMEALTPEQKPPSENETPETRQASTDAITDQDLQEVGLTREEFEALTTAFADEAHIANIIKKLASANPEKVAEMLDRMFDHLQEKTKSR